MPEEITICAVLKAKAGQERLLQEELLKVLEPSRAEEGCIEYSLHESTEETGTFVFYETWANSQALADHIESAHYQEYRQHSSPLIEHREVFRLKKINV